MAELSEADKRMMLGANYKEVLEKAQQEGRAKNSGTSFEHRKSKSAATANSARWQSWWSARSLFVSNFYAVSGPSVMLVGVFGIAAMAVSSGWYLHLRKTLRNL